MARALDGLGGEAVEVGAELVVAGGVEDGVEVAVGAQGRRELRAPSAEQVDHAAGQV